MSIKRTKYIIPRKRSDGGIVEYENLVDGPTNKVFVEDILLRTIGRIYKERGAACGGFRSVTK